MSIEQPIIYLDVFSVGFIFNLKMGVEFVQELDAHFDFMFYKNLSLENLTTEFDGIVYTEEWRPIYGYEQFYKVSSFGRIKSLREGIILRQQFNDKRYLSVGLQGQTFRRKYRVHRLVAYEFVENPHNKPEVNHNDFNKSNNFFMNLTWMTGKENTNHAQAGGRRPSAKPRPPKPEEKAVRRKKVINTETGVVYDSAESIVWLIGGSVKELRRKLSGERNNDTPYKYLGEYHLFYPKQLQRDRERYFELRMKLLGY